jgi:hypothetical protein
MDVLEDFHSRFGQLLDDVGSLRGFAADGLLLAHNQPLEGWAG